MISDPPHSITSLGKRSTDNEHRLWTTDLNFTQVSSCSQWNKLLEKRALELYLSRGIVPESCFSCGPGPESYLQHVSLWCRPSTVNSVNLLVCSKCYITEKAISRGSLTTCHVYTTRTIDRVEAELWASVDFVPSSTAQLLCYETDPGAVVSVKQLYIAILSKHLNCWRTKGVWDTWTAKSGVNIKVRHTPPHPECSSTGWFTHCLFFCQNETENVCILEHEMNSTKAKLAKEASGAHWPMSLLITDAVYLLQWGHFPHKDGQGRSFVSAPWPFCDTAISRLSVHPGDVVAAF